MDTDNTATPPKPVRNSLTGGWGYLPEKIAPRTAQGAVAACLHHHAGARSSLYQSIPPHMFDIIRMEKAQTSL